MLQLDSVPGRIADHSIEPAFATLAGPIIPHAGEGDLPVQKPLFGDQRAGALPDVREGFDLFRLRGAAFRRFPATGDGNGIAETPVEPKADKRLVLGLQVEPVERMDEADEPV